MIHSIVYFLHDFDSFIESFVMLLLTALEPIIICLTVYVVPISSAYGTLQMHKTRVRYSTHSVVLHFIMVKIIDH